MVIGVDVGVAVHHCRKSLCIPCLTVCNLTAFSMHSCDAHEKKLNCMSNLKLCKMDKRVYELQLKGVSNEIQ